MVDRDDASMPKDPLFNSIPERDVPQQVFLVFACFNVQRHFQLDGFWGETVQSPNHIRKLRLCQNAQHSRELPVESNRRPPATTAVPRRSSLCSIIEPWSLVLYIRIMTAGPPASRSLLPEHLRRNGPGRIGRGSATFWRSRSALTQIRPPRPAHPWTETETLPSSALQLLMGAGGPARTEPRGE